MTFEIITLTEAVNKTGYTKPYLKRLFSDSGLTRLGKSENFLLKEFLAFFRYRSKVHSEPKKPGENNFLRNERIRLNWRKELDTITN